MQSDNNGMLLVKNSRSNADESNMHKQQSHLLSFLGVHITEGDSTDGVMSSEEQPETETRVNNVAIYDNEQGSVICIILSTA